MEETTGRGRRRRAAEEEAAGVTASLARAVRLAGESRLANAGGDNKNIWVAQSDMGKIWNPEFPNLWVQSHHLSK